MPPSHHAALTRPADVGALLRAINGYRGSFVVQCALQLAPLVFVRAGELRRAEWSEFDFAAAVWRIPAARMKMRQEHLVPLARQAVQSCTSSADHRLRTLCLPQRADRGAADERECGHRRAAAHGL